MSPRVLVVSTEKILVLLVDRGSSRQASAIKDQEHIGFFKNGVLAAKAGVPPQEKYAAEDLYRQWASTFFGQLQP